MPLIEGKRSSCFAGSFDGLRSKEMCTDVEGLIRKKFLELGIEGVKHSICTNLKVKATVLCEYLQHRLQQKNITPKQIDMFEKAAERLSETDFNFLKEDLFEKLQQLRLDSNLSDEKRADIRRDLTILEEMKEKHDDSISCRVYVLALGMLNVKRKSARLVTAAVDKFNRFLREREEVKQKQDMLKDIFEKALDQDENLLAEVCLKFSLEEINKIRKMYIHALKQDKAALTREKQAGASEDRVREIDSEMMYMDLDILDMQAVIDSNDFSNEAVKKTLRSILFVMFNTSYSQEEADNSIHARSSRLDKYLTNKIKCKDVLNNCLHDLQHPKERFHDNSLLQLRMEDFFYKFDSGVISCRFGDVNSLLNRNVTVDVVIEDFVIFGCNMRPYKKREIAKEFSVLEIVEEQITYCTQNRERLTEFEQKFEPVAEQLLQELSPEEWLQVRDVFYFDIQSADEQLATEELAKMRNPMYLAMFAIKFNLYRHYEFCTGEKSLVEISKINKMLLKDIDKARHTSVEGLKEDVAFHLREIISESDSGSESE